MCALSAGTQSFSLTKQDRAWRSNLETPHGSDPVVSVNRQLIGINSDGFIVTNERPTEPAVTVRTINLELLTNPSEKVTLASGLVLTTAQLFEGVKLTFDRWRQDDLAHAEAVAAAKAAREAEEAQRRADEASAAAAAAASNAAQGG